MNDCIAALPLSLRQDYVRLGKELEDLSTLSSPVSAASKQTKSKHEKKRKMTKDSFLSDFLTPDETLILESSEESEDPTTLFDDSGRLILEPSKKGHFKIHFKPPPLPDPNLRKSKMIVDGSTEKRKPSHAKEKPTSDTEGETKSKSTFNAKDSKKNVKIKAPPKVLPEEYKIVYIAKYSLVVGNLLVTREFFIIGKLKKGTPPKEKKSKSKDSKKK